MGKNPGLKACYLRFPLVWGRSRPQHCNIPFHLAQQRITAAPMQWSQNATNAFEYNCLALIHLNPSKVDCSRLVGA